jgi:hypothetical protein
MASPLETLMQNPAFAAFVTASGLQEEILLQDAARRRRGIESALGIQTEGLEESGRRERRGISGGFESRGTFRSGDHQTAISEQESDQGRQMALTQLAASEQLGDVESNLLQSQVNRQFDIVGRALEGASEDTLTNGSAVAQQSGYNLGLPTSSATGSLSGPTVTSKPPSTGGFGSLMKKFKKVGS